MTFDDRRQRAVDYHASLLRAAVQALRGMGEHEMLAELLADERDDTIIEAVLRRSAERRCCHRLPKHNDSEGHA